MTQYNYRCTRSLMPVLALNFPDNNFLYVLPLFDVPGQKDQNGCVNYQFYGFPLHESCVICHKKGIRRGPCLLCKKARRQGPPAQNEIPIQGKPPFCVLRFPKPGVKLLTHVTQKKDIHQTRPAQGDPESLFSLFSSGNHTPTAQFTNLPITNYPYPLISNLQSLSHL